MTAQTTGATVLSATPKVNLLPPEIADAARFRRFQFAMGGVVLAAAAVVGLLYTQAHHSVDSAQQSLQAAQAQQTGLQNQVNALQSVKSTYDEVGNYKALRSEALGSEVEWSFYLADLSLRIPDSVWLTNMTIAPGATAAGSGAPAVPGTTQPAVIAPPDQIATITFTGVALNHDDVAKWLSAIAAEKGWSDPYVTGMTETKIGPRTVVDWTGTADITSAALSNRYTQSES